MRGIQTLLMTILPPSNPGILRLPVWSSDIESAVSKVNTYIRGLGGESVTIIDCDPFFADGNKIREEYARDTLHLNKQGYNVLVTLVREALDSLTIGEDEM